jgi:hypothetical protein
MKVLLEIKDDKVAFVMELLRNFKFVKAEPLSPKGLVILEDLVEAVDEMNQVKSGKKKSQSLDSFLNEL